MNRVYPRHAVNLDITAFGRYIRLATGDELSYGQSVAEFERAFAECLGAQACVATSSAQGGLYLTLRALEIGQGDEVIMPAYISASMPAAVIATGARPVFADVDPHTFNIDPALARSAVTDRTRALVTAHLFGRAANMQRLQALAAQARIALLEDCSHAAGARCSGRPAGTVGDAGFFSFDIWKNMACFGGGAVTFSDVPLAGSVRRLAGSSPPPHGPSLHMKVLASLCAWLLTRGRLFPWTLYLAARVLDNLGSDALDRLLRQPLEQITQFSPKALGRMANLQAAVGLDEISRLPQRNASLSANGRRLAALLAEVPGIRAPDIPAGELEHIYLYFRILVEDRPEFRKALRKKGVDTQADDLRNCASLEVFSNYRADCPVAAALPERSMELPNSATFSQTDIDYIAAAVRETVEEIRRRKQTGRCT